MLSVNDPDIDSSEWDSLGLTVPPPDYESGAFSTFFCPETEQETILYSL